MDILNFIYQWRSDIIFNSNLAAHETVLFQKDDIAAPPSVEVASEVNSSSLAVEL